METVLVHLSDLHLGGTQDEAILDQASGIIASLQPPPSVIIVSGDLVNGPNEAKLRNAQQRLRLLCEMCRIDPQKDLVVIPGNHDYIPSGWMMPGRHSADVFDRVFNSWRGARYFPGKKGGRDVAIFPFNSNTDQRVLSFARGRVEQREFARFDGDYQRLETSEAGFGDAFKVAVVHHHPLAIAEAESRRLLDSDAYLALDNAGTFLRKMAEKRIDLVLHGHKHHPFFARFTIPLSETEEAQTSVLAAGSACKFGNTLGNSFNVITIDPFGEVEVRMDRWEQPPNGGGFVRKAHHAIASHAAWRERVYSAFLRQKTPSGVLIDRLAHHCSVDEFGDSRMVSQFYGFRVGGNGPVERFPQSGGSTIGTFAQFQAKPIPPSQHLVRWEGETAEVRDQEQRFEGAIIFEPPLTRLSESADLELSYRMFNAFALTAEQRELMFGEPGFEVWREAVEAPLGILTFCLQLSPALPFPKVFTVQVLKVTDGELLPSEREQAWCQAQCLHVSELTNTVTLVVPKPLRSHTYGIQWSLPSKKDRMDPLAPDSQRQARLIRDSLLRLDTTQLDQNPLQAVLGDLLTQVRENFGQDTDEQVDLGLMTFDKDENRLRFVAGHFDRRFWEYRMRYGQGVAGRAYKLNKVLLLAAADGEALEFDYSAPPPSGMPNPTFLLAVPLRYPLTSLPLPDTDRHEAGWVVGVLILASNAPASKLLSLRWNKGALNKLIEYFYNECYNDAILPALGLQDLQLTPRTAQSHS